MFSYWVLKPVFSIKKTIVWYDSRYPVMSPKKCIGKVAKLTY